MDEHTVDKEVNQGKDSPDNLFDTASASAPPVKWQIGKTIVDREFVQFVSVYLLLFVIAITSLINLTANTGGPKELWASLLSMTCGVLVPQPKFPRHKKATTPQV